MGKAWLEFVSLLPSGYPQIFVFIYYQIWQIWILIFKSKRNSNIGSIKWNNIEYLTELLLKHVFENYVHALSSVNFLMQINRVNFVGRYWKFISNNESYISIGIWPLLLIWLFKLRCFILAVQKVAFVGKIVVVNKKCQSIQNNSWWWRYDKSIRNVQTFFARLRDFDGQR